MGRSLLALAVVSVAACGGAGQGPAGPADHPDAHLEITYQHPETESYTYSVICREETARVEGADLDAEAACASLSDLSVMSRLVDGPPDEACPEIYGGADVVSIQGSIDGEAVDATVDRTDGCGISDWDNLLDDLLPPPHGEGAES